MNIKSKLKTSHAIVVAGSILAGNLAFSGTAAADKEEPLEVTILQAPSKPDVQNGGELTANGGLSFSGNALGQGRLERTPSNVFSILKNGGKTSQLTKYVAFGEWEKIDNEYLKKLPAAEAAVLYDKILNGLLISSQSTSKSDRLLSLDDIIAFSNIAPKAPNFKQVSELSVLVKDAIAAGAMSESFFKSLEDGTRYFGNDNPVKKRLTGQLLSYAGLIKEAAYFLPTAEEAKNLKEFRIVGLHINSLSSMGRTNKDSKSINEAWQLNEWLMGQKDTPKEMFPELITHSLILLPYLNPEQRKNWLTIAVDQKPVFFNKLLLSLYQNSKQDQSGDNIEKRAQNLRAWKLMEQDLYKLAKFRNTEWHESVAAFTLLWIREVENYVTAHAPVKQNSYASRKRAKIKFVSAKDLLLSAPQTGASNQLLKKALRYRVLKSKADLHIFLGNIDQCLETITEFSKIYPKEGITSLNKLLVSWGRNVNPNNAIQARMGTRKMKPEQGIPLTRARQNRNLKELAQIYKKIKQLDIGDVSDEALLFAFVNCHSRAEIFKREDIEAVCGPISQMPISRVRLLASTMYGNLEKTWSREQIQKNSKTGRSELELKKAVTNGYKLVVTMMAERLQKGADWKTFCLLGDFYFGWAVHESGKNSEKKVVYDMADYSSKIKAAFSNYGKAIEAYKKEAKNLPESAYSIYPYALWFDNLMLAYKSQGSIKLSDVEAYGLERIREAILTTVKPEKHMELFAQHIIQKMVKLPPHHKKVYIVSALDIIKDNPAANPLREHFSYYKELLNEVKFKAEIAEETHSVGTRNFALQLSLQHTIELAREGGGFAKYITPPGPYGRVDYRRNLASNIRKALQEKFEVKSITFSPPQTKQRLLSKEDVGEEDWSETPIAYVHLVSLSPSNDRIPPIQIDLDFIDKQGKVVLPLESKEVVIKSSENKGLPIPNNLKVFQTLNEKKMDENIIKLEVRTTANGLIPTLDELFEDVSFSGFEIVKIVDEDLQVNEYVVNNTQKYPVTERNWKITLALPDAQAIKPTSFSFLKPKAGDLEMKYYRYKESDLVEVDSKVEFNAEKLESAYSWVWWLLLIPVIGIIAFVVIRLRSKEEVEFAEVSYHIPDDLNPFTSAAVLISMQNDARVLDKKDELNQDLKLIEESQFAANTNAEVDYQAIVQKWVQECNRD